MSTNDLISYYDQQNIVSIVLECPIDALRLLDLLVHLYRQHNINLLESHVMTKYTPLVSTLVLHQDSLTDLFKSDLLKVVEEFRLQF